jgi:hypothetical protein
VLRIVSGDKHTARAAVPPSGAEQRHPCAKLKTKPAKCDTTKWLEPKNLKASGTKVPKGTTLPHHQRLHLANKRANFAFWLCR